MQKGIRLPENRAASVAGSAKGRSPAGGGAGDSAGDEGFLTRVLRPARAGEKEIPFLGVPNQDGSLRWVFPEGAPNPTFLSLYNPTMPKAKAWKLGLKLLFATGMGPRLFRIVFRGRLREGFQDVMDEIGAEGFSAFLGTKGADRKIVLELNDGRKTSHFLKVPISEDSSRLIENEFRILSRLAGAGALRNLEIPQARMFPMAGLLVGDMAGKGAVSRAGIGTPHLLALAELASRFPDTRRASKLVETVPVPELARATDGHGLPEATVRRVAAMLRELRSRLASREGDVPVALSHGDFTPWNMYESGGRLHVYDWELAREGMPLFHDLFHFAMQSGVMAEKKPYRSIRLDLEGLKKRAEAEAIGSAPGADWEWSWGFYLLHSISGYLPKYWVQRPLHDQAHWLLNAWENALEDWMERHGRIP